MVMSPQFIHHGAVNGVTGSCHELRVDQNNAVLVDCGLFQGDETGDDGAAFNQLEVRFDLAAIRALIVTHVHIDHVGRLPYLLAAGFDGPIYCSQPSAVLLPLVLEDALKIGFTRDTRLLKKFQARLQKQIVPLEYGHWSALTLTGPDAPEAQIRLHRAGHILGSAFVECKIKGKQVKPAKQNHYSVIFSGDLGAPHAPLLYALRPPSGCDYLVLESTYGDRKHPDRKQRHESLRRVVEHALSDGGTVLLPAFSIGRTQELLYELEEIIHRYGQRQAGKEVVWDDVEVIVDSPLAARFTEVYRQLQPYWDEEAQQRLHGGRHPLSFEQLLTIDDHNSHKRTVAYLKKTSRPCIVIAASGMCSGGRIMNYLKALIEDPRTDIVFTGYQARGTPGRMIQAYADKPDAYVELDDKRYSIQAGVHTLSGYSAHADQTNLVDFVRRMRRRPYQIRLVHGDDDAKQALQAKLAPLVASGGEVVIAS